MKVLVACEESQEVCKAFRAVGDEAFSCDIQEPSGGHPEWHILGDALAAIEGGQVTTMDGQTHDVGRWDLLIAHPPCTYLSNVSGIHFSLRYRSPEYVVERWKNRALAAVFFMRLLTANAQRIAIENPVGFINTAYKSADQTIHPYMFADSVDDAENYVTKATCLWLVNLPKLRTNGLPKPDNGKLFGKLPSGKNRTWEDTVSRSAKARSKTFPGIAKAMAEQWGGPEKKKKKKLPTYTVLIRTPSGTEIMTKTNDFAKARRTYARYKGSCRLCIDGRELRILEADKLMDDGSHGVMEQIFIPRCAKEKEDIHKLKPAR